MKIPVSIILMVLRFVLNDKLLDWLKAEAKKTDTPIDDTAVAIIEFLLSPKFAADTSDEA